jgi:hypothetical protein
MIIARGLEPRLENGIGRSEQAMTALKAGALSVLGDINDLIRHNGSTMHAATDNLGR